MKNCYVFEDPTIADMICTNVSKFQRNWFNSFCTSSVVLPINVTSSKKGFSKNCVKFISNYFSLLVLVLEKVLRGHSLQI